MMRYLNLLMVLLLAGPALADMDTHGLGGNQAITGDWDFSGGGIAIESGTVPPACSGSQLFLDTDATPGQRLMACESGSFVVQGDGGGAEVNNLETNDPPNVQDNEVYIGSGPGAGSWVLVPDCNDTTEKIDWNAGVPACVTDQTAGLGADSVGTSELDDGADTPLSGEYIRVDTVDQAGIEYRTAAETLSDIGAAASSHGHTLAGPDFANQGTTVDVLHGNASGNPSWGPITSSDVDTTICQADGTNCDATQAELDAQDECSEIAGCVVSAITASGVTYENLSTNLDIGFGASQVPQGSLVAPAAGPLLTGDARTQTTAPADDSDMTIANTAFVQQEINGAGGTGLTCSGGQCNVDLGATIDSTEIDADTIVAADVAASLDTRTAFQIIIADPDPAAVNYMVMLPSWTGTITEVRCQTMGGTSFTIDICDGEDWDNDTCTTSITQNTIACDADGEIDNTLTATGFVAHDRVSITMNAESGTVNRLIIKMTATVD